MNSLFGSLVLWPLAEILNKIISQDNHIREKMSAFSGKTLTICGRVPDINITVNFEATKIHLSAINAETLAIEPDATISGSSRDLLQLLLDGKNRPLANPKISISGDAKLSQDLYTTINELDLHWADYLAPYLGDILSNQIDQASSDVKNWARNTDQSIKRNLDEYLKEEVSAVPDESQLETFDDRLDLLKIASDRLQARIHLLNGSLDKLSP
jgi:ubiquinone biosynthesis protein UbiJ